jgi:hypothetical protein
MCIQTFKAFKQAKSWLKKLNTMNLWHEICGYQGLIKDTIFSQFLSVYTVPLSLLTEVWANGQVAFRPDINYLLLLSEVKSCS